MPKFRKKPVVIEAIQFTGSNLSECLRFMGLAEDLIKSEQIQASRRPCITTPSGTQSVADGDWIIRSPLGELYTCKPDVFAATYWTVNEDGQADDAAHGDRDGALSKIRGCARCGGDHDHLVFRIFSQPFAPREAHGITWTHWAPCPATGDPILLSITDTLAKTDEEKASVLEQQRLARLYVGGDRSVISKIEMDAMVRLAAIAEPFPQVRLASPEAEAAARAEHGDGDGTIPGRVFRGEGEPQP